MTVCRWTRAVWLLAALALAPVPGVAEEKGQEPRGLEVGLLFGSHDNYFFSGGDNPPQSTGLVSGYFSAERQWRLSSGKFALDLEIGGSSADEINNADQFVGVVGGTYKFGRNRVSGELFARPQQVYFEEGDGVFFDQTGIELGYRRDLRPGLWVGLEVELERWAFDPAEAERDARGTEVSASLRVPLSPRLGLRATLILEEKDADAARFDVSGSGFAIALEAQPSDRVNVFARYKRREREYDNASPGDRNFARDDTVQDIVFNLRWQAGRRWGLRGETFYRDGESTRPDRNYDGLRALVGAFYQF